MTGRGVRTLLGFAMIVTSLVLALLNHGFRVLSFTKEELLTHVLLVVAGYALSSGAGWQDVTDAAVKLVPWKGKSE